MNETLKTLKTRRSVRQYDPRPVEREKLEAILEAGTYAPSAMGRQSVTMAVLTKKEDIAELSALNAAVMDSSGDPFYGAPTVLIVLADAKSPHAVQDGSLVIGNLMNAASALGLGSCWINRAKEVFDSPEGKALLKKWGIKGEYTGVGNCILGYPDEEPEMKPRKENYIYYVR